MNEYLSKLVQSEKTVQFYTTNGYQESVRILDYGDTWILAQDQQGRKKLIYKHAISTINLD